MSIQTKMANWDVFTDELGAATGKVADDKRRTFIKAALDESAGNISTAANNLGISRSYLSRFIKQLELISYATELRIAAGATTGMGRPRKDS